MTKLKVERLVVDPPLYVTNLEDATWVSVLVFGSKVGDGSAMIRDGGGCRDPSHAH